MDVLLSLCLDSFPRPATTSPPTPPQRHLQTRQARARGGRVHPSPRHPLALRPRAHQAQVLVRKRRQAIRQGTPYCLTALLPDCCISSLYLFCAVLISAPIVTPHATFVCYSFLPIFPYTHTHPQALKAHDRVEAVAHWGCNVVYVLSCWSPELRDLLGNAKVSDGAVRVRVSVRVTVTVTGNIQSVRRELHTTNKQTHSHTHTQPPSQTYFKPISNTSTP